METPCCECVNTGMAAQINTTIRNKIPSHETENDKLKTHAIKSIEDSQQLEEAQCYS